jgi:peptidoglycan/LPS O-acetylase OafA/YrhL
MVHRIKVGEMPILWRSERRLKDTYIPAIDGMRAIAIGLVIAAHFGAERFVPGGFGVTLFFFISGFLITRLLILERESSGKNNIPAFYVRRFLRLGPALMMMIAVVSLIYFLFLGSLKGAQILAGLFYYMNFYELFGANGPLPLWQLWSLAVEEHYYLIFPLVFALSWHRRERFLTGLIGLIVVVLLWRVVLVVGWSAPENRTNLATDTRIDSILFGAILAALLKTRFSGVTRFFENRGMIAVAVLMLLVTFIYRDQIFRETIRYSIQGVTLIPLFYSVLFSPRFSIAKRMLEFPAMVWIGKLSYSLYLYHFAVLFFVRALWPEVLTPTLVSILITFAAASLSYYYIEKPFQKLRARFSRHPVVQNGPSTSVQGSQLA